MSYLIRVPFLTFVKAIREPFLIAFTTASSEAALPKALEVMERFGVPKNIVGFVLPTGYSFNLDGTTLYLSLASVFVAQLAGVQMTFGQQLVMMLTLMLTSKGVAGVPRAALVVLTATLTQFGLPLEGAAILLGIDQIMDMGRTAVNVMGNCIATAVVARWEGVFDDAQMRAFAADRQGGLMRIAVVGARGQLGAAIVQECASAHEVTAFGRAELDVSDDARRRGGDGARAAGRDRQLRGLQRRRRRRRSSGRRAERQRVRRPRAGAGRAVAHGATLVHYSTDFVFDGTASAPYTEDDRPNPRSVYAASKLLGEWFAADAPRAYVLRVESLFGRAPGRRPGEGQRRRHPQHAEGRRGRRRCSRIAPSRRPTSSTPRGRRASCSSRPRRRACITASIRGGARGSSSRRSWRGSSASSRGSFRCGWPTCRCARRGRSTARCRTRSCGRSASTMPSWQDALARYASRVRDDRRSQVRPTARHDVRPGESMPDACTTAGFSRSRRIRKSANDSVGGCSFARMPLPDSRRSSIVTPSISRRADSANASSGTRSFS